MSDETSAVAAVAPEADAYFAALSRHDALNARLRDPNKTELFAALAAAGITHVVLAFDGYGDDGQIESVEARAGTEVVDLPPVTIRVLAAQWGEPDPISCDMTIADLIERLAYDLLGETHAGWQDGDGAYGEFVFDVAAGTITLDHNDRYIATDSYSHTF